MPQSVVQMVRQGRMTALVELDGSVRGIVVRDVIRRLVAKTMAQQLGDAVEVFTAPYQCVVSAWHTSSRVSLNWIASARLI